MTFASQEDPAAIPRILSGEQWNEAGGRSGLNLEDMPHNPPISTDSLQINQKRLEHRNRNENDCTNVVKLATAKAVNDDNKAGGSEFNYSGQLQQQGRIEQQPRRFSHSQAMDLNTATTSVYTAWPVQQSSSSIPSVQQQEQQRQQRQQAQQRQQQQQQIQQQQNKQ